MSNPYWQRILFHNLGSRERQYLKKSELFVPFAAGELLLRDGIHSKGAYILLMGEVDIFEQTSLPRQSYGASATDAQESHLVTMRPGMILEEKSSHRQEEKGVIVVSRSKGILFKMDKEILRVLIERAPQAVPQLFLNILSLLMPHVMKLLEEVHNIKNKIKGGAI